MKSPICSACALMKSSVGRKLIVALTGLALVLFLAGHLAGNLVVFLGQEAFNDYAQFLHHMLHGAGVWIARIGLLIMLTLHVWATISLTRENRAARQAYQHNATIQASRSSRLMIWSGLTILAFIVYHLLHLTAHVGNDFGNPALYTDQAYLSKTGEIRHDAWKMVIDAFHVPLVTIFYIIAMTCLCSHLHHGVASIFQTLGLNSRKARPLIEKAAMLYSAIIYLGFVSIPLAIWLGNFGR